MKVALVGPGIIPIPPNGYGAVEKHIANLAEYLRKRGHGVTILNKLLGEYAWGIRVGQLLRDADYDVVHSHTSFMGGYLSSFAPVQNAVYTSHSPLWFLPELGPRERWGMMWEHRAVRYAKAVIALTQSHADKISAATDTFPTVRVIPNGVDCQLFKPNGGRSGDRVCMVGKVVPHKQTHIVASAAYEAHAEFHIIGPTPDKTYLRQVRHANPDAAMHEGLSEQELADLLGQMDIFVHASVAEAMSLAVLEAMASGLAVVYPPSCDEVVGGSGVRVEQPDAYKLAITMLLQNDSYREQLGLYARQRALDLYSWDRVAELVEGVYLATLADLSS